MLKSILIVDDHPMVLMGMAAIVKQMDGFLVAGLAKDAIEAVAFLSENPVDMVLTDIHLPEINGLELCQRIKQDFPQIRVVGMSTFNDQVLIGKLISAGALGFVSKSASPDEIAEVFQKVSNDQIHISAATKNHQPNPSNNPNNIVVTRREKEIIALISQGLTTKEIADQIFVSPSTVDSHRKNLLEKFDVLNTASLITKASKMGLI